MNSVIDKMLQYKALTMNDTNDAFPGSPLSEAQERIARRTKQLIDVIRSDRFIENNQPPRQPHEH